jgi:hypothetical protein
MYYRAYQASINPKCPGDCLHMNCTQAINPECQAGCGQGLIDVAAARCPLPTLGLSGPNSIGGEIASGISAGQFNLSPASTPGDPNADCNGYSVFKPVCVAVKSLTKGFGAVGAPCTIAGHTLPLPCWALLAAGALVVVMVVVLKIK